MCRSGLLVLALLTAAAGRSSAGWVAVKNETDRPVVIQETCVVANQLKRGKPIRLMPGEVYREYQSCPGAKTVRVAESGGPRRPLCQGELTWDAADRSFAVRRDGAAVALRETTVPRAAVTRSTAPDK